MKVNKEKTLLNAKKNSWWLLFALFLLLGFALYGQFLHNPIVFDDIYFFMLGNDKHSAIETYANPNWFDLRALPYASLAWSAALFGFDLGHFRVVNLLLHTATVTFLWAFLIRLYRHVLRAERVIHNQKTTLEVASFITIVWFALHPVAVYAVGYLVQRSMLMATLFSVMSVWAYLQGYEQKRHSWLWVSVACYFLATHSKEHVVMLPAVIVAMLVLLESDWRATLKKQCWIFIGYAVIGVLTLAQIRGVLGHAYEVDASEMLIDGLPEQTMLYSALTQCALFFKYGILWLLPNPNWMSIDMREPLAQSIFSVYGAAVLGYLLYSVAAIKLLLKRGRYGLIGFGMLLPWLMFMTEFSSVRLQEIFVLYRSYIWAIGGVVLLPVVLMQFNQRLLFLLSILLSATLFVFSMERLSTFSHPIMLWSDAEKLVKDHLDLPGVSRIYYNRGTALLNEGNVKGAISGLQMSTKLNPKMSSAQFNLGLAYAKENQHSKAIRMFTLAVTLDKHKTKPINPHFYLARAISEEALGLLTEAKNDYQMSCFLSNRGCEKASLIGALR